MDRSQDGAIILLVLAGLLILLLTSMMLFDAGQSAQSTVQLQNAADSAAFSQAVVKSRSMNVISYANISKRMMFSYHSAFSAAAMAAVAALAKKCSECSWTNIPACIICAVGAVQIIVEAVSYAVAGRGALDRLKDEITLLNDLQKHLMTYTPWWGMTENMYRGVQNGATATAAWPGPEATLPTTIDDIYGYLQSFDSQAGTNIVGSLPPKTETYDKLPLEQQDSGWSYCAEFIFSLEHIIPAWDSHRNSSGWPIPDAVDWDMFSALFQASASGCWFVLGIGDSVPGIGDIITSAIPIDPDTLYDWRVDNEDWLLRSSNFTLAYFNAQHDKMREDRNYDGFLNDHAEEPGFEANGHWALSRSEISFQPSWVEGALNSLLPGAGSVFGSLANWTYGPFVDRSGPHMWAPQWTARLRPLVLPGEEFGTAINSNNIGLDAMYTDMLPYFVFASTLGTIVQGSGQIFSGDFSPLGNAVGDMVYMYGVAQSYSADNMEGLEQ